VQGDRSADERELMAVQAALAPKEDRSYLLPFQEVTIDTVAHEKNSAVGVILDELSGNHYEWYGYNLSEADNPALIIDTLLQVKQIVTGGDVDFNPIEAKRALDELYQRNQGEGRLGTDQELIMTGIVHRHGFCTGMPVRSLSKDVRNLSDYLHWQARATEFLSQHPDCFDHTSGFRTSLDGDSLRLVGADQNDITLIYGLGSVDEERAFLRDIGLDAQVLEPVGGLRAVIARHLERQVRITAEQNRFVSTATSLIYNQDASQVFGEIALLAQGAVDGTYEESFFVDVNVIDSGRGIPFTWDSLEEEVDRKVSWNKKTVSVHYAGSHHADKRNALRAKEGLFGDAAYDLWKKYWPSESVTMVAKGSKETTPAEQFYDAVRYYTEHCTDEQAKYSMYMFSLFSEFLDNQWQQSEYHLDDAVQGVGPLFEDIVNAEGMMLKPPVDKLSKPMIISWADAETDELGREFIDRFKGTDLAYLSGIIEHYIPLLISMGDSRA
jgi:hypothetical protein